MNINCVKRIRKYGSRKPSNNKVFSCLLVENKKENSGEKWRRMTTSALSVGVITVTHRTSACLA